MASSGTAGNKYTILVEADLDQKASEAAIQSSLNKASNLVKLNLKHFYIEKQALDNLKKTIETALSNIKVGVQYKGGTSGSAGGGNPATSPTGSGLPGVTVPNKPLGQGYQKDQSYLALENKLNQLIASGNTLTQKRLSYLRDSQGVITGINRATVSYSDQMGVIHKETMQWVETQQGVYEFIRKSGEATENIEKRNKIVLKQQKDIENAIRSGEELKLKTESKLKTSDPNLQSTKELKAAYDDLILKINELTAAKTKASLKGGASTEISNLEKQKNLVDDRTILLNDELKKLSSEEAKLNEINRLLEKGNRERASINLKEIGADTQWNETKNAVAAQTQLEDQINKVKNATASKIPIDEKEIALLEQYIKETQTANELLQVKIKEEKILEEQERKRLAAEKAINDQMRKANETLKTNENLRLNKSQFNKQVKDSIAADKELEAAVLDITNAQKAKLPVDDTMMANLDRLTIKSRNAGGAVRALGKDANSIVHEMDVAIRRTMEWAGAMTLFYGSIRQLQQGVQFIRDLNKEMTNIQLVTNGTQEQMSQLAGSYNKLARELGSTTKEVAQGSLEWIRQGKSVEETQLLLTNSTKMSKLANLEAAQATEYMTSIMNGFQLKAEDMGGVLDKLVALDNAYATSVGEIADAMQRSSNSAMQAGVSLTDLASYITIVSSTTRKSAESIGESFN